ncbi:hypothetical protein EDD29_4374 [Actinocorallia herbida]|uniref:Homeodomain-like domain-containing protein n=1 Tax=Actinocorallia herbida TaxID=58109 RepID=A0A3N1CZT2_9ACTN|nr:hypothetical protein EDD29_4374 [Actinocorallia herbida]
MSDTDPRVPAEMVAAALAAARRLRKDVADVPTREIAKEAGISRSTLVRRIGGGRRALDDAVSATGVDPGGQWPVRERALEAGARLISAGRRYTLTRPRRRGPDAWADLPDPVSVMMRLLGVTDFMEFDATPQK